jgi:hypothetical protein
LRNARTSRVERRRSRCASVALVSMPRSKAEQRVEMFEKRLFPRYSQGVRVFPSFSHLEIGRAHV